jgi:hypothetical protein
MSRFEAVKPMSRSWTTSTSATTAQGGSTGFSEVTSNALRLIFPHHQPGNGTSLLTLAAMVDTLKPPYRCSPRSSLDRPGPDVGESFEQRLKRLTDQPAIDTLGWMKMLIQNEHVVELRRARESKMYHCVYLMAHSIMQTVSETMFGFTGLKGTHFFLETFADGDAEDKKFSLISSEIHDVRNVIAHNAYSRLQHVVQYFIDDIEEGWKRDADGTLVINPARYSVQVEDVFRHPTLYATFRQLPELRLLQIKYKFVRRWLNLDKSDPIAQAVKALDSLDANADLQAVDDRIRKQIYQHYGL